MSLVGVRAGVNKAISKCRVIKKINVVLLQWVVIQFFVKAYFMVFQSDFQINQKAYIDSKCNAFLK